MPRMARPSLVTPEILKTLEMTIFHCFSERFASPTSLSSSDRHRYLGRELEKLTQRKKLKAPSGSQSPSQMNERRPTKRNKQREMRNRTLSQENTKREFVCKTEMRDKLPFILVVFGSSLVPTMTCLSSILTLRYEGALIAFGILVFMAGMTLLAMERKIQSVYITYMWVAAFVVIGSITGVSVIGTLIKP